MSGGSGVSERAPASEKAPRIVSPSYPSMPLGLAIDGAQKIYSRYRNTPVDRVDAARLLGFAGLTGPANMAMATLGMYGLAERAGKGEIRVTDLTASILYPNTEQEKITALAQAGAQPQLYRELRERFQGIPIPPEEGVVTYLNRVGFNPAAIRPATRAFMQTLAFLQENGALDGEIRTSPVADVDMEPPDEVRHTRVVPVGVSPAPRVVHHAAPTISEKSALKMNETNINIRGNVVHIEALLDFDGLVEMENQIAALKMILKPKRVDLPLENAPLAEH